MTNFIEPPEAFPYEPPTVQVRERYSRLFELTNPPNIRPYKRAFDVLMASFFIVLTLPLLLLLYLMNFLEGLIDKSARGPLIFYYKSVSRGKVFKKWKVRSIKHTHIKNEIFEHDDWRAYAGEWDDDQKTFTGKFAKKFYLDELPQFYSILWGDMSFVGPRPLAVHHYERDLEQGNITRKFLLGGLLGFGHIRKGTEEFGKSEWEYEYLEQYLERSCVSLILLDLWVIYRGFKVVLEGKGL